MDNRYRDKARGMLLGLAIGDALGAPVEFIPSPSDYYIAEMGDKIAHFHKNSRLPEGVWTDDTSMALCIADSLLEMEGYDSYDIMNRFNEWAYYGYRKHPQAPMDIGNQTLRALDEYENNPVVAKDTPKTESAGNGPIMRLAPIIIVNTDIALALEMAVLSCRETHNSLTAEMTTALFATMLYDALHGASKDEIVSNCSRWITNEDYKEEYLDKSKDLINRALDANGAKLRDLGGYIVDTFAIALWGLIHYDNFKDGMLAVIRLGGDTDTNAACYGQLAGAYYGYKAIPEEWQKGVYLSDELIEIADNLLEIPNCPIIRTRFEDNDYFKKNGAANEI